MMRSTVIADVMSEMDYAEARWGTEFDSKNTINDWGAYINIYLGKALAMGADHETQYRNLIKVAGLAINAARRINTMPKRHYD